MTRTIRRLVVCAVAASAGGVASSATAADAPATEGVAVVELFTSEGCSSCPPADAALADVVHDARAHHTAVYPLAWHVDYWNRLGWTDPFSTAEASQRQQAYAAAAGTDEVYTPQAVVDGQAAGFVGSDRARLARDVAAALARPATAAVALTLKRTAADAVTVDYAVTAAKGTATPAAHPPLDPQSRLQVVLVQRRLTTAVSRGENGGRTLPHENVVRASRTVAPADLAHGRLTLPLPPGAAAGDLSVIAFVQTPPTLAVTGAASADVPPVP